MERAKRCPQCHFGGETNFLLTDFFSKSEKKPTQFLCLSKRERGKHSCITVMQFNHTQSSLTGRSHVVQGSHEVSRGPVFVDSIINFVFPVSPFCGTSHCVSTISFGWRTNFVVKKTRFLCLSKREEQASLHLCGIRLSYGAKSCDARLLRGVPGARLRRLNIPFFSFSSPSGVP